MAGYSSYNRESDFPFRAPARAAGEGQSGPIGRLSRGHRGRRRRGTGGGTDGLADVPLKTFLAEHVVPYEKDEVTRLIIDEHDVKTFAPVSHLTVGAFRDWLLSDSATESLVRAGVRPNAGNCRRRVEDLPRAGSCTDRAEMSGRDQVPQHHWAQRAAIDAPATQPSDRRYYRHRRQYRRRADVWQRRCGNRHQSCDRQHC